METILLTIVIFTGIIVVTYIILYNNIRAFNIKINEAESIIDDFFSLVIDGNIAKEDQSDEESKTEEQIKEEQQQGLWGGVVEGLTGFNNAQTLILCNSPPLNVLLDLYNAK